MRHLFSSPHSYLDYASGAAISTRSALRALVRQGEQVDVFCGTYFDDPKMNERAFFRLLKSLGSPVKVTELRLKDGAEPCSFRLVEFDDSGINASFLLTASLLAYKDGVCGVWQVFMIDVLETQGIIASARFINVKNSPVNPNISVNSFKVKSTSYGQGTENPNEHPNESIWGDHAVVEYGGYIYDPSYGLEYGSEVDAIVSFVTQCIESVGITTTVSASQFTLWYGKVYTALIGAPNILLYYHFELV